MRIFLKEVGLVFYLIAGFTIGWAIGAAPARADHTDHFSAVFEASIGSSFRLPDGRTVSVLQRGHRAGEECRRFQVDGSTPEVLCRPVRSAQPVARTSPVAQTAVPVANCGDRLRVARSSGNRELSRQAERGIRRVYGFRGGLRQERVLPEAIVFGLSYYAARQPQVDQSSTCTSRFQRPIVPAVDRYGY